MLKWMLIIGPIYLGILVLLALYSRRSNKTASDFMMGGYNIGALLGLMTFAATLFSTFTLMGMPDFFRTHGVGAWIFIALSDASMFFLLFWFAYRLRKRAGVGQYKGMSGFLSEKYQTKWAGYLYFIIAFMFLVPYVAIQIRGVAIFLDAAFNKALPYWGWSVLIVVIMLLYSETGGLKAIMYSDVLQGTLLMIVLWIIAGSCVSHFGGVKEMFRTVAETNPELLSVPGPKGLFSAQFLIASFVGILMIPVTQPQVSSRIAVMRDGKSIKRMVVALGVFAMLVIIPTIAVGMYGAVVLAEATTADYLSQVLLFDHPAFLATIVLIGLVAAAISTSDSQIFAMGAEFRSLLAGDEKQNLFRTKIAIGIFALACLIFSILSNDQLVLLARVSFTGTALAGPMILLAVLKKTQLSPIILWVTGISIIIFVLSLLGVIPSVIAGARVDLSLFLLLCLVAIINGR